MTTLLTDIQKRELMQAALIEAERGMAKGEAPIGAVVAVMCQGAPRVVGRGHNRVNGLRRRIAHAEIVAFEDASADDGGGNPRLPLDAPDVILVSTLEPCVMCLGAAMEAGVSLVLYGLPAPADSGTQRVKPPESPESSAPHIEGNLLPDHSRRLFEQWLEKHRGTDQARFVEQLLALTSGS